MTAVRDELREDKTDASLEKLRGVLFADEHQRLGSLEHRLDDPLVRAAELSAVMNEAMNLASKDARFARVLAPTIEKALFESVRANPEGISEALFPVMMPTIRRVVSSLVERTFENFNRVLDVSVSPRSFAWRLESMRTGRPFAEIVLYHTLAYRVEQVLLIHRETGLLLAEVGASASADGDLVSAMLTAIQDFARDSFQMQDENIRTFKIGNLMVLVETSPHATIAAAVRGTAPAELADGLAVALESIELRFSPQLTNFVGDTSSFETAKPLLESCLTTVYAQQAQEKRKPAPSSLMRYSKQIIGLLVVAGLVFAAFTVLQNTRWQNAMRKLRFEPGFLIIEDSQQRLVGLHDPLSRAPSVVMTELGYADTVQVWGEFQSLEPKLVLQRVKKAIEPDSSTVLQLENGILRLTGYATEAWLKRAKLIIKGFAGITGINSKGLQLVAAQ